jgi:hypothetical protein
MEGYFMPALQISLSGMEITALEAEANEQTAAIVAKMNKIKKKIDWATVPRIVASTVAAQIIRAALPQIELETAEKRKRRLENENR